jgi:tetratricopeptide (TPR) repeat protein
MNVFDGLLGYEKLMLLCGFILFVFALVVIALLIAQKRDFKLAMVLIIFAIVLMGFPGIQVVKFNQGIVEIDKIRAQPSAPADPAQKEEAQQVLGRLAQRAEGNPQLQAKISDGYRAIGEVDKAYQLAQSLLKKNPSTQVQATLVPVLTAKLNEVQATAPLPAPDSTTGSSTPGGAASQGATKLPSAGGATGRSAGTPASAAVPMAPTAMQQQIASIATQLQDTGAPLPAASHAALAKAYVVLGQPQKAQANVDAAFKLNPGIKINAAVLHAARAGSLPGRTQP